MLTPEKIIQKFNMKPLPVEGGYYSQTYRSPEIISGDCLPGRYHGGKALGTAIYYLLTPDTKSKLHRLPTDEIYHFYLGDPVEMLLLHENGEGETITLGPDIAAGHHVQFIVPHGTWQGSHLIEGGRFAFMGTTMAPGFDCNDYEAGNRDEAIKTYPRYRQLIEKLSL